jgi:hypothetical protein
LRALSGTLTITALSLTAPGRERDAHVEHRLQDRAAEAGEEVGVDLALDAGAAERVGRRRFEGRSSPVGAHQALPCDHRPRSGRRRRRPRTPRRSRLAARISTLAAVEAALTSRETIARTPPGREESSAVSSTACDDRALGHLSAR